MVTEDNAEELLNKPIEELRATRGARISAYCSHENPTEQMKTDIRALTDLIRQREYEEKNPVK
jgi:hypothetical protein